MHSVATLLTLPVHVRSVVRRVCPADITSSSEQAALCLGLWSHLLSTEHAVDAGASCSAGQHITTLLPTSLANFVTCR